MKAASLPDDDRSQVDSDIRELRALVVRVGLIIERLTVGNVLPIEQSDLRNVHYRSTNAPGSSAGRDLSNRLRYRLGDFEVDPYELQKNGRTLAIEPKPLAVLLQFVQSYPAVVEREEMMNRVWGTDVFVSLNAVDRAIFKARGILRENGAPPDCIKTLPRKGWKLTIPVQQIDLRAGSV